MLKIRKTDQKRRRM